ncbi:MAG: 4Fe-4S dicluster domain-containing protein [Akkermansiaceae bacterium]|nr:4Fe-4S dicluster domain-containing protein [Akkermansiaceae bacterium]NNM29708.1 4Fe-4S dicluster domain-containing protein [Akkermansiaceae bacterium]
MLGRLGAQTRRGRKLLRPPGAQPEADFLQNCIACGQCANVCPNKCITLVGLEAGIEHLGTPKIDARAQACILCMACTQVCPTQALEKLEPTEEGKRAVKMGLAFVSEDHCYSYAGRTCGVCYRACPLPGEAMTLGVYETPIVHPDHCVGCGLCEQACVQMPQAIRIVPQADQTRIDALLERRRKLKPPASPWKQGAKWDDPPNR